MSIAEIYVGAQSEGHRGRIETLTRALMVLPVDGEVAKRGGFLRRRYRDSHGLDLIDALIAATAEVNRLRLVTRNVRHFPMLDDVLVPYA
jgi:predicted nucleic acid-binding protein